VKVLSANKIKLIRSTISYSTAFSICFGLIQDQITIRLCPEYFTIWHPNPLGIHNLTILALYWGVVATWWVGLILGILLSWIAVWGDKPLPYFAYIRKLLFATTLMSALSAILAGIIAASSNFIAPNWIMGEIARLPLETKRAFSMDLAIHTVAYDSAALLGILITVLLWRKRFKPKTRERTTNLQIETTRL